MKPVGNGDKMEEYQCRRCGRLQSREEMEKDTHYPGGIKEENCLECGAVLFENGVQNKRNSFRQDCLLCEIPAKNRNCDSCFYKCRNFDDAVKSCGITEWIYLDGEKETYGKNHTVSLHERVPTEKQKLSTWRIGAKFN